MPIRLSPAIAPEASGTMYRLAALALALNRSHAARAPMNIIREFEKGTTRAMPRPTGEGRKRAVLGK